MFQLKTSYEFIVPKELTTDRVRSEDKTAIPVSLLLRVEKNSRVINIELEIGNTARDHRLRLLIPTGIASQVSFASNQFGIIHRDVVDQAMAYWEAEDWDERPD